MKIKTVCECTGLSDRAVRYYIEEGLISPKVTEGYLGRKAYDFTDTDIAELKDIATLRKFGFSIPDIKEMHADPDRILPLVRNLQMQKQRILSEESTLLQSLLSIKDGQTYTISGLAAKLSAPVENKAVPSEDSSFRFWKKFGKACFFLPFGFFPALYLFIGLHYLFIDAILNVAAKILYFILSPIALGLSAHFFIFNRKGRVLYIGCIITTAVFLTLSLFFDIFAEIVLIKNYAGVDTEVLYVTTMDEYPLLPKLSENGNYTNLEYYNVVNEYSLFYSESTCFIFGYSQEEYFLQKEALENIYTFQSQVIRDRDSVCEPMTEIDGYTFRLLSIEEYKDTLDYPKEVMLVGYSDQTREIVYLMYQDYDCDYISSLPDFIRNSCNWTYMNRESIFE